MPRFVAIMRIGAKSLSNARFRNEKHSISNMWTSSINKTYRHRPIPDRYIKYGKVKTGAVNQ